MNAECLNHVSTRECYQGEGEEQRERDEDVHPNDSQTPPQQLHLIALQNVAASVLAKLKEAKHTYRHVDQQAKDHRAMRHFGHTGMGRAGEVIPNVEDIDLTSEGEEKNR